jgi:transcriptional regulator with GAF, ATPase, and Fis domain
MPVSVLGMEAESGAPGLPTSARSGQPGTLRAIREAAERGAIIAALNNGGSCRAAALLLDVSKRNLFYKMRALGVRTQRVAHAALR